MNIDGKTIRCSRDGAIGKGAIHVVSAWTVESGPTLGQVKVDDKSNEITAIPELLELLAIEGCIVTIDALGCQKKIAQKIRDEKADYVLCLKDNQKHPLQDVADRFAHADQIEFEGMALDHHKTAFKGHGCIEVRECRAVCDPLAYDYIRHYRGWADIQTIIRIKRDHYIGEHHQTQTVCHISSLPANAAQILAAIRAHWVLDVTFREDHSRIRNHHSPTNMAVLRKMALNILKLDTSKSI